MTPARLIAIIIGTVLLTVFFILNLKPEASRSTPLETRTDLDKPETKVLEVLIQSTDIASVTITETNLPTESNFSRLSLEDLLKKSAADIELYLIHFRYEFSTQPSFEEDESELLIAVFSVMPEVAIRYLSEYHSNPLGAQNSGPKIVEHMMHNVPEEELKLGFHKYLDTYQMLPATWYLRAALQTEIFAYFEKGDKTALPPEVANYSLNGFLKGEVSNYPVAYALNPEGAITNEQLIDVFLSTSPRTVDLGMDELIFDVINLQDTRTFAHLLECIQYQPKRFIIYRQLKDVDGLDIEPAIITMMDRFSSMTHENKIYTSLMALDFGNLTALKYLLKHPEKDFQSSVTLNIDFILKQNISAPNDIKNVIEWAQKNIDNLVYDNHLKSFVL